MQILKEAEDERRGRERDKPQNQNGNLVVILSQIEN